MAYLRISSLPLDDSTKRRLVDELTAVAERIIPGQRREWTTVHFTPYQPGDLAIGGRFVTDHSFADTHLEIATPAIDEETWEALRSELSEVLAATLGTPVHGRWHLNVQLHTYNAQDSADAGDESLATSSGVETGDEPEAEEKPRKRRGKPLLLLGFIAGAILTYRWLSDRLRNDATVDTAPPTSVAHGEAVDAGGPDPRTTATVPHTETGL